VWFAFVTSGSTLSEVQTDFAREIYRSKTEDIAALTSGYLAPIAATAGRSAAQLESDTFDPSEPAATHAYMVTTLISEPRILSMSWYPSDGTIYETRREGVRVVSARFDPNASDPAVTTIWYTQSGVPLSETVDATTLSVSDRLLKAESEIDSAAVSEAGVGSDGRTETVTFAASSPGADGGTVFVEIGLAGLGEFIADYEPATESRVFLVSGIELVAHNRPETIGQAPAGSIVASLDDAPTSAASGLALGGDGWQILTVGGDRYHAVSERIAGVYGLDWTVVTVGPEDDFSPRFVGLRRTDAIKLATIAAAAIILAIPLARFAVRDVGTLHTAAQLDSLTGLVNRRTFEKHGAALIAAGRRRRRSVGALMVDIDHFKQLNDTYGHHAGDEVLEAVAGRISHSVAKTDLVARLGGDEIALLLEGADLAASRAVAARLRNAVTATPISTNRGPIYVTVSIGASATGGTDRARLDDVLKAADRALYTSKRAGRDRVTAVNMARSH
jgi:diguanylate cyclase (GGDEF)-like protein